MGKKSPSVPKPPNPEKMISSQAKADQDALRESARINAVNLYGPEGSTTYGFRADGTPHSQYTQLTPGGQYLYDAQQGIAADLMDRAYFGLQGVPNQPFSLANMPYDPTRYNTAGYKTFNPISYPVGAGANVTFPGYQNQAPTPDFFGGQQNYDYLNSVLGGALSGAQGGKGGPSEQLPQPNIQYGNGGFVPASAGGSPVPQQGGYNPSGTVYQTNPGGYGGEQTTVDYKYMRDAQVYATPENRQPSLYTSRPGYPGMPNYQPNAQQMAFTSSIAPDGTMGAQTYGPAPTGANGAPAPLAPGAAQPGFAPSTTFRYGDPLSPEMMTRSGDKILKDPTAWGMGDKTYNLSGYGLDLFKKYGAMSDDEFAQARKQDRDLQLATKNLNLDDRTNLLYATRPTNGYLPPNPFPGIDKLDRQRSLQLQPLSNGDRATVLEYRLNNPYTGAAQQGTPMYNPPAPGQVSGDPYYNPDATPLGTGSVGGSTNPDAYTSGMAPQQGAGGFGSFDMQAFQGSPAGQYAAQALGGAGKGGASQPPPPGGPYAQYGASPQPGGNLNVLPYDPRSYGNINGYVNNVQDAVFDQQMRNLQPVIDQQYDRQYQMLADRGLPVGSKAFNDAVSQLNRDVGNQYQQAANQAVAAGGAEASRLMGMEQGLRGTAWNEALGAHQTAQSDIQQRLQIEQSLRNQAIQEYLMGRTQAFNEASAYLQGAPALNMPTAPQMPQYQMKAPDVVGAHLGAYNAQMQAYQAQAAQSASAWQGAAGIVGGLGSMKCSMAYKHDDGPAERIIDRLRSVPIRTWRYKPEIDPRQELHIGPYAEDWKRELGLGDGKEINVIDAFGVVMKSLQELADDVDALKPKRTAKRTATKRSTKRATKRGKK